MGIISSSRQVGQSVRSRRKELGLTQRQLAERSGVSERSIVSLELGDATGMRLDKLLEVLSALGLVMNIQAEEGADQPGSSYPIPIRDAPSPYPSAIEPRADGPVLTFLKAAQAMHSPTNPSA